LDDGDEFSCADSDVRAEAEFASQTQFYFITGPHGEPEKYSDECVVLVSCKISLISTSNTSANILDLKMF